METNPNDDLENHNNKGSYTAQESEQIGKNGVEGQELLKGSEQQQQQQSATLEDLIRPFKQDSGIFKWWGGLYQFINFLAAISAMAVDGINLFIFLFINAPVDYHCSQMTNDSYEFNSTLSKCIAPEINDFFSNTTVDKFCTKWSYDTSEYSSTITTEFDLVCSQAWVSPTFQLCYILGTLAGDLLGGTISDRLGRRNALRLGVLGSTFCVVAIGFSPWLPLILTARVLQGMSYTVMYCPTITLFNENVLPEERSFAGPLLDVFYSGAIMILAGLAYFIRDCRILHFSTSFIVLALIPLAIFADESIRWLIQQDRLDEAQNVLERLAKRNSKGAEYSKEEAHVREQLLEIQRNIKMDSDADNESFGEWFKSGLQQLYGNPVMRMLSIVAPLFMFLMSTLYNGVPFNANNFNGSSYWYMFGMGAMEMASVVSGAFVVKYCTRVFMAQWTMGVAAICVLLTTFMPEYLAALNWVLVMAAMWSIALTYNMEFMWLDEIFPTTVRQRGGAMCHFVAHLSGFAALLITDANSIWWLPNTLLFCCGVAGILLAFLLPETKGLDLCNTVDDVVRRRDQLRKKNTIKVENKV